MYNKRKIERKWQEKWRAADSFRAQLDDPRPKYYALTMFPYPSGSGIHVGHVEGYTAIDAIGRYKRQRGFNVFQPMGYDAFGLPAEQYALATGNDPAAFTYENIATFRRQLYQVGLGFDAEQEVITCDPAYYKWTQWIFTLLYEKGLAKVEDIEVNWCAGLNTVLANEEILTVDGKMVSERGHHPVEKRAMRQWVLKITAYAEQLLAGLDTLDWPAAIKEMQRHWIGKSHGAEITFAVAGSAAKFTVFTTRSDTLFGASYCVLAPEHPLVAQITTPAHRAAVAAYQLAAKQKTDLERTALSKDKTGVFTGAYAVNPVSGTRLPIWISDYVLASYGSGAIMAVPAHDERDYEFARKFDLPIRPIIAGEELPFTGDGVHINSEFLNGLDNAAAQAKMNAYLAAEGLGRATVQYKLRDWIFSRQRYWGEPFPVIHWEDGSVGILDLAELPLRLPHLERIESSDNEEGPLAKAGDWLVCYKKDGTRGRRETNTMPQWAGSCWYYLGYLTKHGDEYLDLRSDLAQKRFEKWLPVDFYIGGAEHAVLHLLYARFWHKVLFDAGIVPTAEPFQKLFNQGLILGEDGEKMSKSLGNVVIPDEFISEYGADCLRTYILFMGPLEADKPWNTDGVEGPARFLERVWRFATELWTEGAATPDLERLYHQTIKKVTADYETLGFNTAISQLMILLNEFYKVKTLPREYLKAFLIMLNPIAPHLTEELNEVVLQSAAWLVTAHWPEYEEAKTLEEAITVVVQVNGKIRARLSVPRTIEADALKALALADEKVQSFLTGPVKKIIVVPQKLVSIVV